MSLAFVFPGQGSQSIGMLSGLAAQYPEILATFQEASDALGFDLWKLTQEGPEAALNSTENTQPAILTASIALYRVWLSLGGKTPEIVAGHSLGEYSALVAANVLSLADAVKLVALRGRLMQKAVPDGQGAMAAILGLSDEVVTQICQQSAAQGVVEAVNFNAPGQVVIAGEKAAVEAAIEALKAAGAKRAILLPVSVPSHCALMKPAAESLGLAFTNYTFHNPVIPVVQNVAATVEANLSAMQSALMAQLHSPVLWVQTVQTLEKMGATTLIECGPGKVLTGLNKRIVSAAECLCLDTDGALQTLSQSE